VSTQVATESSYDEIAAEGMRLPAWPVLTLIWGYPVFWALGATVIAGVLLTVVMLTYLAYNRSVRIVPGFGALAAFLAWVIPCAIRIDSTQRLLGYFYRLSILIIVVVAFLYAINATVHLTRRKVVSALTFLWFVTIVGGLVAMAFPEVRLSTPVGLLLPDSLTSNFYVHDLFFPPFAEIQHPYGSPTTFIRPSAPFPYANSWGVALVLLTPVAVARFLMSSSKALRLLILIGLAIMIVPATASSNRGMFAALGLAGVYIVVRLAVRDRAAPMITIGLVGAIGAAVLIANGVISQISTREQYGQSIGVRLDLYRETFSRTLHSPLLGYGAPRPSAIDQISVGTQGYVWMLMFSYGFVGLLLFCWFLWRSTLRTWRSPGDVDLVLHSVLVVASVVIIFYGLDIMQLLVIMLVAGLLLRNRYGLEGRSAGG
jgi:hypothetical protein